MRAFLRLTAVLASMATARPAFATGPTVVGPATAASLVAETGRAQAAEASAASQAASAASAASSASSAVTAIAPAPVSVTAAGTTQATATATTTPFTRVTSAPTGSGVILNASFVQQRIMDRDASGNPVLIYPPVGASVEGQAANLPVTTASAPTDTLCTQASAGVWNCGN